MARPSQQFSDEQLRQITEAIRQLDVAFPHDNGVFLDEVIDAVLQITRRVYGARRYGNWLVDAGISRRPSNTTLQKAVDRARGRVEGGAVALTDRVEPWPISWVPAETGTRTERSVRATRDLVASRAIGSPGAGAEWMEARIRADVAERALEHEVARNRQLQAAVVDLERRLGEALVSAPIAAPGLTGETLQRLQQTFETFSRLEGGRRCVGGHRALSAAAERCRPPADAERGRAVASAHSRAGGRSGAAAYPVGGLSASAGAECTGVARVGEAVAVAT